MLTCLHLPTYYCNITLQGILNLLFMVLLWGIEGYIHSLRGSDIKAPEIIVALEILSLESNPLFSLILRSICGSSFSNTLVTVQCTLPSIPLISFLALECPLSSEGSSRTCPPFNWGGPFSGCRQPVTLNPSLKSGQFSPERAEKRAQKDLGTRSSAHSLGSKKYGGRPCLVLSGSSSIISFLWYSQILEVGVICRFVSMAAVKKTSSKGSPASFFASSLRILISSILSGQSYALMTSFARGRGPSGISCRFLKMWCLTLAS